VHATDQPVRATLHRRAGSLVTDHIVGSGEDLIATLNPRASNSADPARSSRVYK
jgi:hypothetical protein